jgi:hypothetical protein
LAGETVTTIENDLSASYLTTVVEDAGSCSMTVRSVVCEQPVALTTIVKSDSIKKNTFAFVIGASPCFLNYS